MIFTVSYILVKSSRLKRVSAADAKTIPRVAKLINRRFVDVRPGDDLPADSMDVDAFEGWVWNFLNSIFDIFICIMLVSKVIKPYIDQNKESEDVADSCDEAEDDDEDEKEVEKKVSDGEVSAEEEERLLDSPKQFKIYPEGTPFPSRDGSPDRNFRNGLL